MDEFNFNYADADSYEKELAEFYTYSEMDEFALNFECFVKYMREQKKEPFWNKLTRTEKCLIIQEMSASFDSTEPEQRLQAARIILYILQGSYGDFAELEGKHQNSQSSCSDCSTCSEARDLDKEKASTSELELPSKLFKSDHGTGDYEFDCLQNATANAYLLYEQGVFQPLCSLLRLEVSLPFERCADHSRESIVSNSRSTSRMDLATGLNGVGGSPSGTFERRSRHTATLADNERIRVVLNCIYHMVESLRRAEIVYNSVCLLFEQQNPGYQSPKYTFDLLFDRNIHARLETLRKQFITELEEPLEHSKMPLAIILLDMMPTFVRAKNPHYPIKKVILLCWKVLLTTLGGIEFLREEKTRKRRDALLEYIGDTQHVISLSRPKVTEEDIKNFLQNARQKYFNYQLPNDSTTLFGLPMPVQTSVAALRRNLYTSLGEVQLKAEERYNKYPFSQKEFIEETPTERLYSRILPEMAEYVIAILKVILASLPSSKAKNDAVTILSDVLTPETDTNEVLSNSISLDLAHSGSGNVLEDNIRVAIDINRHKELIIKGASSIIILLLKHFRLNHVYQFENFAQYLILANCMPLVLKFLDQNICRYFQSKHDLAPFNYPQCALYIVRNGNERPPLTSDNVDEGNNTESPRYFCWRNVFSAINLLRAMNKLVKGKQARTILLVVYKSAPVLKRCMKAKLGIFQLYVLKLLKLQARYLGRQWRKTNMDIISAIYMRCRHRLNDDWAYANETTRTKSFDYHKEENELSIAIRRFNTRRYPYLQLRGGIAVADTSNPAEHPYNTSSECQQQNNQLSDILTHSSSQLDELAGEWDPKVWEPMDNSLQTALAWEPVFSDRFLQNYKQWLEQEVYGHQTDWDGLLLKSRGLLDIYC
uniref:Uncharacterized protein n=1 Tax=Meloidogyne enterolobii TaxID=390850 RepID=A0A6V7UA10_MELEN|nr:unnamed protein product [Meloidogyne enterolobii]